jgi:hypothetical protein
MMQRDSAKDLNAEITAFVNGARTKVQELRTIIQEQRRKLADKDKQLKEALASRDGQQTHCATCALRKAKPN